jgi:hypothetical protein
MQGVPYLVPVQGPGPDGKWNLWHQSRASAIEVAEKKWVRMTPNLIRHAYDVVEPVGNLPTPVWPDLPFDELVELGFRGRMITTIDHPHVQTLLGAA